MRAVIYSVVAIAIVAALAVSTVRFWSDGRRKGAAQRRLAAAGTLLTLAVTLMIYSGEINRQILAALTALGIDGGFYETTSSVLHGFDVGCTHAANFINGILGVADVGYRAYPPAWPAALLIVGYGIRFLIYRSHTKRGNEDAALTGAVYWSHITTYVMVIAFLIVVTGVNPWVLVPVSLLATAAIVVSLKLIAEDLGVLLRALAKTVWTGFVRLGRQVAYFATEFAARVRAFLAYASKAYVDNVRTPLRAWVERVDKRNQDLRKASGERLKEQDARLGERFRPTGVGSSPPDQDTSHPDATQPRRSPRTDEAWYDFEAAGGQSSGDARDAATAIVDHDDTGANVSSVAEALWDATASRGGAVSRASYEEWRRKTPMHAPTADEIERRFGAINLISSLVAGLQATPGGSITQLEAQLHTREQRTQ
jgi:hypothetical protein